MLLLLCALPRRKSGVPKRFFALGAAVQKLQRENLHIIDQRTTFRHSTELTCTLGLVLIKYGVGSSSTTFGGAIFSPTTLLFLSLWGCTAVTPPLNAGKSQSTCSKAGG